MPHVALVGSPNCGKTTVFNRLTGLRQKVGNWAGVTVEKKIGTLRVDETSLELIDLPGLYSLNEGRTSHGLDMQLAYQFLTEGAVDVILHVLDASSLRSGLRLTLELLHLGKPVFVVLNMTDVAAGKGVDVDCEALAKRLGCEVMPMVASQGIGDLPKRLAALATSGQPPAPSQLPQTTPSEANPTTEALHRLTKASYAWIDGLLGQVVRTRRRGSGVWVTDVLDGVLLNQWLAIPCFLFCMYLIFYITINLGGAFIDFFDGIAGVFFVEAPAWLLERINTPAWLQTFIADGVGGGMQLVASFIPVIGFMFLCLSFLEASGYMTRAAFIVDRLMGKIGLPGRAFIPLIVGLGCNVPAVMASRSLPAHQDRLTTAVMAPFMSCGARLTVYALFAAAFFPGNSAALLVFGLYLMGVIVAIASGLAMRRWVTGGTDSSSLLVMPAYHLPTLRNLAIATWARLSQFLFRAGKAIVAVVIILNVVNSWGVDGSFGQENTENSYLSEIGKTIAPLFEPMGVTADNWPAVVGIFTGIFAKEVVVGSLDALYGDLAKSDRDLDPDLGTGADAAVDVGFDPLAGIAAAFATIGENFSGLDDQIADPLGLAIVSESSDGNIASLGVRSETISAMRALFGSTLAVFSYLVFILLYVPCVATLGAIYREHGHFWMWFSATWSTLIAYGAAVIIYQGGVFLATGATDALLWLFGMILALVAGYGGLILAGRQKTKNQQLIPLQEV